MNKFSYDGITGHKDLDSNIRLRYNLKPVADKLNRTLRSTSQKLAERVLHDTEKFVPIDTGELRESARIVNSGLGFSVVYTAEHANAVYWGYGKHAPPTCRLWFETALALHKNEWLSELQRYIDNAK